MTVDTTSADAVVAALEAGARANLSASCRRGSIDVIRGPGELIATGDLHDNPPHLARVLELAGMSEPGAAARAHVTLHEVIHSDRLYNGMDTSYRSLVRVAAAKAAYPEHAHVLLANHELSQIVGAGIVKDGVPVVRAFNDGVEYVFGSEAERVQAAIERFIRSMPLALRCVAAGGGGEMGNAGDLLCAHSLPAPEMMERFDPSVLERELTEEDYVPRRGAAHLMVWGRDHSPEQLISLGRRWNVRGFLLGHEDAPEGVRLREPNALIINSAHLSGVCLRVDLQSVFAVGTLIAGAVTLSDKVE